MSKTLLLIVNPAAGMGRGRAVKDEICAMYQSRGWACRVRETAVWGDASRAAREESAACDLVLCAGGDGTLSETLNGLTQVPDAPPLCYVPMGSTNDLALSAGLPRAPLAAAEIGLTGVPRAVDAGSFDGRVFSYVACFGAFSRTSYETDRTLKNHLGHLAYLLTGVQELGRIQSTPVRVECDGKGVQGEFLFGAVCNTRSLGGVLKLPLEQIALQDGRHEVLLVRMPQRLSDLSSLALDLLSGAFEHPLLSFHSVREAVFHMPGPLPWSLDGERADAGETVRIRNLHHAYRLMLPVP
ncbi:MAG: YegS/Rv2252/BmrU family lipid kinase [Clostridia bacterium]|nr:YegS/Rv2252/BmrU family lipid kinase [Clostridia bacterium]